MNFIKNPNVKEECKAPNLKISQISFTNIGLWRSLENILNISPEEVLVGIEISDAGIVAKIKTTSKDIPKAMTW